jgi:PPOX class probable F420-dependent enzyme
MPNATSPEPAVAAAPDSATTPSLTPDVRAFLAAPRYAAISTVSPDGSPHQALVWYLLADDGLIINSRQERHWPRNVRRDPRISVAVQDWQEPDHWVGLTGRAELLREGDAALEDIMTMARRYDANPEAYRGQNRVSFLVRVKRTFEYGKGR